MQALESILDTTKTLEEFDIWLEIKSENEVQRLKQLYQAQGKNVQKLFWCNWSQHEVSAAEIVEMLNCFPNLKFLKLSSWDKEFTGEAGKLELPNIKCIEVSECQSFVLEFLANALPENVIKCVKIDRVSEADDKFCALIKKQASIKRLNIHGDFKTVEPLTELKLERLRCLLPHNEEKSDEQRTFLQTLIKSQPDLINLDLLNESDYAFSFVDDGMFADISALSKLENLAIGIDGMSASGIKAITNLSALKDLQLKTNKESSLVIFKELSGLKNATLEHLILHLWSFDIPAETYEAMGANFENLKSLKITLGTRHKISFFAKAFPNLENLRIKFGEANNRVEFDQIYDGSENITQSKLKKLCLRMWGAETIDTESFFKFLGVFTSLEKLQINTKFPFTAEFINQLAEKLNSIKNIKLSTFEIRNSETFPTETIDALKLLRTKVNFASLSLSNIQNVDFGNGHSPDADGEFHDFTFQPLVDALKGVYSQKSSSMANIRIHNNLELIAGKDE